MNGLSFQGVHQELTYRELKLTALLLTNPTGRNIPIVRMMKSSPAWWPDDKTDDLIALGATVKLSRAGVQNSCFSSEENCELTANIMCLCGDQTDTKYVYSWSFCTYEDRMRIFYWSAHLLNVCLRVRLSVQGFNLISMKFSWGNRGQRCTLFSCKQLE